MITDREKWHYLAVKSLSALLRGIAGNNHGDFYCLNCFRPYTTENKLKKHKNACENHDYIPEEENKILNYNHGEKSMRAPFVIYADLECLLEKMSHCHNNPEKSSTKNKLDYYRGKNCMEEFCKDLKEHATKIISNEKKEMIPLTREEEKISHRQKKCYICKKRFSTEDNNKNHHKVKDHCHYAGKYRGAAHDICILRYKMPKEIPVVFHNGSAYDYHFIIKELAEEFEGGNTYR